MTERGFVTVAAGTFVGETFVQHTADSGCRRTVSPIATGRRFGEKVRDKLAGYGRAVSCGSRWPGFRVRSFRGWISAVVWYGLGLKVSKKPMPVAPVTVRDSVTDVVLRHSLPDRRDSSRNEYMDASRCIRCCACGEELPPDGRSFDALQNPHRLLCTAQAAAM